MSLEETIKEFTSKKFKLEEPNNLKFNDIVLFKMLGSWQIGFVREISNKIRVSWDEGTSYFDKNELILLNICV